MPFIVQARKGSFTPMNLRAVDLNLLGLFDALIAQRSVSRTAASMGLTQSAVSHALRRLRLMFDDDLLIRKDGRMQPTIGALRIAEALRPALAQIESVL